MVLRRTLPSRVSAEPETKDAAANPAENQSPEAKEPDAQPAPAATPEEQNAAISAALDEDFPAAQAAPAAPLEDSFAATPAQNTPEPQAAPQEQPPQPEPAESPTESEAPAPQEPTQAEAAAPEEAPAAPSEPLTPSRPADNPLKPKVRQKKPRNFAFTPAAAPAAAEETATEQPDATLQPAEDIEGDPAAATDRLESYGLLNEPADTLTAGAAPAPAMVEEDNWAPPPPAAAPDMPQAQSAPAAPETEQPAAPETTLPEDTMQATTTPYTSPSLKDEDETPILPEPAAPMPEPVAEESPAPASDLPWVAAAEKTEDADDWSFAAKAEESPGHQGQAPQPETPTAPLDIYAPQTQAGASQSPYGSATTVPPLLPGQQQRKGSAPELPKSGGNPRALAGGSSALQWGIGAAVVLAVAVGVYQLVKNDASQERVARLTGALTETTEKLPPEMGGVEANPSENLVPPEQVIAMDGTNSGILPPPPATVGENSTFQPLSTSSSAVIDFADVPASEANRPIVADGTEQMPDDIGLIAKFQQAVAAEKARQTGEAVPESEQAVDQTGLSPAEKEMQNTALQQKLQAELAAYRETLATTGPKAAPKPSEFLRQEDAEAAAQTAPATQQATLSPPPATPAEQVNPSNLPILPEPSANTAPQVRTLADFDVEAFAEEKERVRIPKGIKPRFSSTDFPQMEILSFVPGRGIIAFNRGREGVLLIGESMEGWELISVAPDNAEFRNGKRTQYVSAE